MGINTMPDMIFFIDFSAEIIYNFIFFPLRGSERSTENLAAARHKQYILAY
jgi:hypothetical protein